MVRKDELLWFLIIFYNILLKWSPTVVLLVLVPLKKSSCLKCPKRCWIDVYGNRFVNVVSDTTASFDSFRFLRLHQHTFLIIFYNILLKWRPTVALLVLVPLKKSSCLKCPKRCWIDVYGNRFVNVVSDTTASFDSFRFLRLHQHTFLIIFYNILLKWSPTVALLVLVPLKKSSCLKCPKRCWIDVYGNRFVNVVSDTTASFDSFRFLRLHQHTSKEGIEAH